MLSKKSSVLFAMVVGALAMLVGPPPAAAECSGDDCFCYLDYADCLSYCPPETDPAYEDCARQCRREQILCAKCCCCQCYYCSPAWGCGGGFSAEVVPSADDPAYWAATPTEACAGSAATGACSASGDRSGGVEATTEEAEAAESAEAE